MFYWSFTSLVHFWPPPISNPDYAHERRRAASTQLVVDQTRSISVLRDNTASVARPGRACAIHSKTTHTQTRTRSGSELRQIPRPVRSGM